MNLDPLRSKIHNRTSYIYLLVISYHSFTNLCVGFVIYVHVLVIIVYSYILNKNQTLHGVIIIFIPYNYVKITNCQTPLSLSYKLLHD